MTARRALILLLSLLVAAVAAAVLAARGDSRRSLYDGFSNRGRLTPTSNLAAADRADLDGAGVVELRLLAERGGLKFLRGTTANGESCLILTRSVAGRERLGALGCPSRFPSDDMPVADLTSYVQGLDDAYPAVTQVAGFAADGIGAVGVRTPAGDVRWTPVTENVYEAEPAGDACGGPPGARRRRPRDPHDADRRAHAARVVPGHALSPRRPAAAYPAAMQPDISPSAAGRPSSASSRPPWARRRSRPSPRPSAPAG